MNPNWLLRMAKWARRPPSILQVKIAAVAVAVVLAIVALDHFGLWPDWAQMDRHQTRLPRLP
ncbi:MAG: hypothetical protein PHX82_12880 [Paracoccaceae bacterium]|nr:hypothetical protein [Paracoccaceae bacterium]